MGNLKPMPILMDTFLDWFVGKWSNQSQVFTDPRAGSLVRVIHELVSEDEIRCVYYLHKSRSPYRDLTFTYAYNDTDIVLTNKLNGFTLVYQLVHGGFVCTTEQRIDDRLYLYKAYLRQNYYRVSDQCFDEGGELLRGLANDSDFIFEKVNF